MKHDTVTILISKLIDNDKKIAELNKQVKELQYEVDQIIISKVVEEACQQPKAGS